MLLIEAARIKEGGGLGLLQVLVRGLQEREVDFKLILNPDVSLNGLSEDIAIRREVSIFNRKKIFRESVAMTQPDSLLCFGNFPPPEKYKSLKTYTYFHRVGLIEQHQYDTGTNWRRKLKYTALSYYLKYLLANTDKVGCQSAWVQSQFAEHFSYTKSRIDVLPFYDERRIRQAVDPDIQAVPHSFMYVSNDALHKNHSKLIEAWTLLAQRGFYPELSLTLSAHSAVQSEIEAARKQGASITCTGVLDYDNLLLKMQYHEYAIYPSLQESLGLGLVEAAILGLKVIGADLPYTYAAVKPTATFDPFSAEDIAQQVHQVCQTDHQEPTRLLMPSQLQKLINTLIICDK